MAIVFSLVLGERLCACVIEAWPNYIKSESAKQNGQLAVFKSSTCPPEVSNEVSSLLMSAQGVITEKHLHRILKRKGVEIRPKKIKIVALKDMLLQYHPLKKGWHFVRPQLSSAGPLVGHGEEANIQLECSHCDQTGTKVFKVEIHGPKKGKKVIWGKAAIVIGTEALVAVRSLAANTPMDSGYFRRETVYSENPGQLFTDEKALTFYKTNKPLLQGLPLKVQDLSAMHLVRANHPVKVIFESEGLNLSAKALPLYSGKHNEMIRLRNVRNNKIIVGKVVHFNKVRVGP